jgi:hypothetical protein
VRLGPHGNAEAHLGREARSGAEEHVVAPELSSRGGRARSHGTRGSAGAHLDREARSEAEESMATLELNSARRRGPGPRATWQHRSLPQQGGEVRGRGTRGGSEAHLCREVWSEVTAYVAARGCTSSPCLDLELICGDTRSSGCRQYLFSRNHIVFIFNQIIIN